MRVSSHTHVRTYTHTQGRTHIHTYTHTQSRVHRRTYTRMRTHSSLSVIAGSCGLSAPELFFLRSVLGFSTFRVTPDQFLKFSVHRILHPDLEGCPQDRCCVKTAFWAVEGGLSSRDTCRWRILLAVEPHLAHCGPTFCWLSLYDPSWYSKCTGSKYLGAFW